MYIGPPGLTTRAERSPAATAPITRAISAPGARRASIESLIAWAVAANSGESTGAVSRASGSAVPHDLDRDARRVTVEALMLRPRARSARGELTEPPVRHGNRTDRSPARIRRTTSTNRSSWASDIADSAFRGLVITVELITVLLQREGARQLFPDLMTRRQPSTRRLDGDPLYPSPGG